MPTLESLRVKIDGAEDMQSVVSAMKVLAMVSIRQFEQTKASLSRSALAGELGLRALMREKPADIDLQEHVPLNANRGLGRQTPICAFVFGSQQGLSGQFNEEIVNFTLDWFRDTAVEQDKRIVIALGDHAAYRLRAAGERVERVMQLPATIAHLPAAVDDLILHAGELRAGGRARGIMLFHHKSVTGAVYRPEALRLFPPDIGWLYSLKDERWPGRSLPVFNMDWRELFSYLIRELITMNVERTFAESLLSENSSRLLAMQVAEKNITEHLDDLRHGFNSQRQSEITTELIDIIAGAEALAGSQEEDWLPA